MGTWTLLVVGLMILSGASAGASAQAPYSHDLKPTRGDVMEVHGEPNHIAVGSSKGHYVSPYKGAEHRAIRVGQRLGRAFFGSSYVVGDTRSFGLPAASGDRRWIRYWDDLLLMNVRTGRVLRVAAGRLR